VFGVELYDGKLAPVVAVGRPGYTEALRTMVQSSIRQAEKQGLPASRDMLYIVSNETLAFSSTKVLRPAPGVLPLNTTRHDTQRHTRHTQVRELLECGESVAELCGEEVEAYLQHHNLHKAFLK
jgi:nicotinic acid mononucleotide adenylyltransferase